MPVIPIAVVSAIAFLVIYVLSQKIQELDDVPTDNTRVFPDAYKQFAKAISVAEGYGVVGAIPSLANNPGDLELPHWQGEKLGSQGISVLDPDTVDAPLPPNGGWYRLLKQIEFIGEGKSHVYSLDMTIQEMSLKWTTTQSEAWAENVANYLGVSVTTQLSEVIG